MKGSERVFPIGQPTANQVLANHLAALGGRSRIVHYLNQKTIWDFLAYCRALREQPADRLILDKQQLLQWLIQASAGKAVAYARQRLEILSRYSRALVRAGLLETDLMAEIKASHGQRSWGPLVSALQSRDPEAALSALQVASASPAPGPLAAAIHSYIELCQSLGLKGDASQSTLLDLDRFLRAQGITSPEAITPALIEEWMTPMAVILAVRIRKASCVKRFFDHLCSLQVVARNPFPPSLLLIGRRPSTSTRPFIFTKEQIAAILDEARRLPDSKRFLCRAQTCSTMLALLCALGLRHGEVCRLRLRDLDLARQTLLIDQTKFHKSRYVPFGPKVGRCLQQFLELRRTTLAPAGEDDPLFVTLSRVPLVSSTLRRAFREILHCLRISKAAGQRVPRLHDLRHTFAVHRLLRWYREGVDVQSRLPLLSVFLGHVEIHSTQVYLNATGEMLREANDRFHRHFGSKYDEEMCQ